MVEYSELGEVVGGYGHARVVVFALVALLHLLVVSQAERDCSTSPLSNK